MRRYGIYVSIFGGNGKNIIGKDVFVFSANKNNIVPLGYSSSINSIIQNCKNNGYNCSSWILRSGWTIPKDYPW